MPVPTSAEVPTRMKALLTTGDGRFSLRDTDVPQLAPKEILVKVATAAQNPTDCAYPGVCEAIFSAEMAGNREDRGAAPATGKSYWLRFRRDCREARSGSACRLEDAW